MPRYRIGIDIGGTFTDFCVLDEHGGEVSTPRFEHAGGFDPGRDGPSTISLALSVCLRM
jgi:predicted NBD/HSP70 family sugar kinase